MKCYKQIFTYDRHIGYKHVPNLNVTVTGDYLDQLYDYKIKQINLALEIVYR